jgi:beta-lactamase regulating signal transducer with metallopeptidase domain
MTKRALQFALGGYNEKITKTKVRNLNYYDARNSYSIGNIGLLTIVAWLKPSSMRGTPTHLRKMSKRAIKKRIETLQHRSKQAQKRYYERHQLTTIGR